MFTAYHIWIINTDHLRRHDQSNHLVTSLAAALNHFGNGLIRGAPPQHPLSDQRWADDINMWPNAVGTFKRPLAGVQVYKKFVWVSIGFIKMWIKNIFFNLKYKIMICRIHYLISKLKTKIVVIPRSYFNTDTTSYYVPMG